MSWIDSCASLSASRGGRCAVVAAGFDEIAFVAPLRLGEHAVIDSKVTRSWGTSLEVRACAPYVLLPCDDVIMVIMVRDGAR
jgi:acyl-CoA hydrolase